MSHQTTAWAARPAASNQPAKQSTGTPVLPAWLTNGLLTLASGVLFALACASAWLSYHAQVAYVLAHNGNLAAEARVWALLLDAGTAGVSLLRLYETLRGRLGVATRISLLGCIAASVAMNLLHAPSRTTGGYLVAAVPPVMYAVFLEHLLTNLRGLLTLNEKRPTMWRSAALWINFPRLMWSTRRHSLRRAAEESLSALDRAIRGGDAPTYADTDEGAEAEQQSAAVAPPAIGATGQRSGRGRGPGAKRLAFESALLEQVRGGDLRLFSGDERKRNAAAYEVAASLPAPLSRGAARRYVVQAMPRLRSVRMAGNSMMRDAASGAD